MIALSVVIGLVAAVLLLPTISDLISMVKAPRRVRNPERIPAPDPRLLFLVPAHDEALLIRATVESLLDMGYPRDRFDVVVIADNCTDATAVIAREAGATCLERTDLTLRGKPRAIAWALSVLDVPQYDAMVIIDADALVAPGFARALAGAAPLREKALQAYNDVSNRGENALTRMAAVFSAARSLFMNPLKDRAGLNSPLANGLCIGTGVLGRHGWTAFSICEDWELYAILTGLGVRIESVEDARVHAQEARSLAQSSSQRKRWAAGKVSVLASHWRPLLRSRQIGFHQKLDAIAELTATGPAVHFGFVAVLAALTWLAGVPGHTWLVVALLASLARPAVYTLLAVRVDPEPLRALAAFGYLPFYTVWRLGVQVAALRMLGDSPWVRTQRHAGSHAASRP